MEVITLRRQQCTKLLPTKKYYGTINKTPDEPLKHGETLRRRVNVRR